MGRALATYQLATKLLSPAVAAYIKLRQLKGKEDAARIRERFGHASIARPDGRLWWLHAASVGEAVSLRPLIAAIQTHAPDVQLLLTSGTVSSANMLRDTLPPQVMHQFIPIDTPTACKRFIAHWQPEIGLFTESELWPNLIVEAGRAGTTLALINARMSAKSFSHWQALRTMAKALLSHFALIAAGTAEDAARFEALGAMQVKQLGHLKQDAAPLPADPSEVARWKKALASRPCLIAASIHPGEDEQLAGLHNALKPTLPNLLTIIVPRHPARGAGMAQSFKEQGLATMLRSETTQLPRADIDGYIADTIGELGLWYRLADAALMGGSFIAHGGQNPLEPIRLNVPVIIGPHVDNFSVIVDELTHADGIKHVRSGTSDELLKAAKALLSQPDIQHEQIQNAARWLANSPPVALRLTQALLALQPANGART